jgi:hypothetical protein
MRQAELTTLKISHIFTCSDTLQSESLTVICYDNGILKHVSEGKSKGNVYAESL